MNQSAQQQQPQLRHPTAYHIQQTQLRLARERGEPTPPTPNNSYVSTMDNAMLQMGQTQFYQQLQQYQRQVKPMTTQTVPKSTNPADGNSPSYEGSDMDFGETLSQSMLSPSSASPPDNFDDPLDSFAPSSLPRASNLTNLKSPLSHHAASTSHHHHNASVSSQNDPFGESPGNASLHSFGGADAHDFIFDPDYTVASGSGPIDMKGGQHSGFPAFSRTGGHFASASFDKGHHFPLSAPANIGYPEYGPGHHHGSPFGAAGSLRYPAGSGEVPMGGIPESYDDEYTTQINGSPLSPSSPPPRSLQAVMEKRRRRRESHNAVERRRRDNINEKIQELGQLLPEQLVDGANKPNKGAILRKSVDHIKTLQSEVNTYVYRVKELEAMLEKYRISGAIPPEANASQSTSSTAQQGGQSGLGSGLQGMQGLQISGQGGNGNA